MSKGKSSTALDFGSLKGLKILCVSETGWFDTETLLADIKAAGGMGVSQYEIPWPPFGTLHSENAAGSSALIESEGLNGDVCRVLFDTGWNPEWMQKRFDEEGLTQRLRAGEIDTLVISHEHFDHFWGIEATLQHAPDIAVYVPQGFRSEGIELIQRAGHRGKLTVVEPGAPVELFPGALIVNFHMETLGRVKGENVLYFSVQGKGIAMVTGCGHGGVLNLLDHARENLKDGDKLYAVYGGLHISPFEDWDDEREALIERLGDYGLDHLCCNHCTGVKAVQKMLDAGLPVIKGHARHGSKTDLFLGNGDVVEL